MQNFTADRFSFGGSSRCPLALKLVKPCKIAGLRRRALFVLAKIDVILAWEQSMERERDTQFVELGRYLCEVRTGQYWRLDKLSCFDEFLEKRFPESRRKAYYLMAIHEHLLDQVPVEDGDLFLWCVV